MAEFSGTGYPAATTGIQLDNPIVTRTRLGTRQSSRSTTRRWGGAVGSGEVTNIVVFKWGGTWATSVPIVHIDTGTNVPFTPNGGDITLAWNAEGVFKVKNQ